MLAWLLKALCSWKALFAAHTAMGLPSRKAAYEMDCGLQVLPALAQLVVKCVEALQQAEQSIQQQQPPTADHAPHNPPQAEAALATACELLNNIIAPP